MPAIHSSIQTRERKLGENSAFVEALYAMLLDEIRDGGYEARELALMKDPILYYGRYLDPKTRSYALNNAVANLSAAVHYLEASASPRRLLDLGCGLGMQSILFAARGWEVLGLDMNPASVALCEKRRAYYELRLGRELKAKFVALDFRKAELDALGGKYGAVFSMSAFAQIQPLSDTVAKISALLTDSGRVFLWDENPAHFYSKIFRLRRRPAPQPEEIRDELARHGFAVSLLRGGCAVPRQLWRFSTLEGAVLQVDSVLKQSLPLSFTYILGASRGGVPGS